jgi:hypothetical protein
MQAMFVEAPESLLGSIRRVRVTAAPANSLAAELASCDESEPQAKPATAQFSPDSLAEVSA